MVAPAPEPADVGIVAALPIEVAPLIARLRDVRKYSSERHSVVEGYAGKRLVALIVGGAGVKNARKATELLLGGHRPRWIISAGFAGALDPTLKRNDVVFPHEVVDAEGLRISMERVIEDSENTLRLRAGRLLTVNHIVRTASEKADLRQQTGADLIDMESTAPARVCAERGVRFLSIRAVSDDATKDLPPEVLTILGPSGGYRIGAAVGAVWKRPSSLKDLLRLREHALEASQRLAEVVFWTLERLP
jgi:adenosylhomocysteine nucleosidase